MQASTRARSVQTWRWPLAVGAWFFASAGGFFALASYSNSPGLQGDAPSFWPNGIEIERAEDSATLLFFAHPHCPCTWASMSELERLVALAPGKSLKGHVIFYEPGSAPTDWLQTNLWTAASRLPDFETYVDLDNEVASIFGVETSGATLLYDRGGSLVFQGGITPSRGHEGPNYGCDAILRWLRRGGSREEKSVVYGCSLSSPPNAISIEGQRND